MAPGKSRVRTVDSNRANLDMLRYSHTSTAHRTQAPAAAKGRGSPSLEAPFRLCGKPLRVPALPETLMGTGSGVTLSSILRVKETFLANVYKSGCVNQPTYELI